MKNNNDKAVRQKFFNLKKRYKSAVLTRKRQFKQKLYNKLEELNENNPKEYWELFDQLQKFHNTNKGDNCPIDDKEWINHYLKLLGPKSYDKDRTDMIKSEINNLKNEPFFSELDFTITIDEISKAIGALKNNKAVGIDQVNNEMLKASMSTICKLLKKRYSMQSYEANTIPKNGRLE